MKFSCNVLPGKIDYQTSRDRYRDPTYSRQLVDRIRLKFAQRQVSTELQRAFRKKVKVSVFRKCRPVTDPGFLNFSTRTDHQILWVQWHHNGRDCSVSSTLSRHISSCGSFIDCRKLQKWSPDLLILCYASALRVWRPNAVNKNLSAC